MKFRILTAAMLLGFASQMWAQGPSDPIHFWKTLSVQNPAAAAIDHVTEGVFTSSLFGVTLQNPITSHSLSLGHQAEEFGGAVGLNAGLYNQFTNRFTWAQGIYAFQVEIGEAKLAIGGSAGMLQLGFKPDSDVGGLSAASETKFDASAGIFLHTTNVWVGASMIHIPEPEFDLVLGSFNRAVYASAGGRIYLGGDFSVKPSAQWVARGGMNQLNVNLTGDVKESLQGGVTMSKELVENAFTRLGANIAARLAEKVDVLFGFLTNPNGGPTYEGGLRLTLD